MLISGNSYRESLRRYKPNVYVNGRKIESVADEPDFAPGVNALALTYDFALREQFKPVMRADVTATGARSLKDYQGPWRVKRMAFGAADFASDVGMTWTAGEEELAEPRARIVIASRAAGIEPPIDTVWVRLDDAAGLRASVERSLRLGFQGRMCIHPDQVTVVNEIFTPSPEEAVRAKKIVDAFKAAEASGLAAIQVDGAFVDYPVFHRAERVLATLAAIRAKNR